MVVDYCQGLGFRPWYCEAAHGWLMCGLPLLIAHAEARRGGHADALHPRSKRNRAGIYRVRRTVAVYGQILLFYDQSMREKAWRSRKRVA